MTALDDTALAPVLVRRIMLEWARRYASLAALLVVLGVVVAAAPSRSPRLAEFDYRQFAADVGAPRAVSPTPVRAAPAPTATPSPVPAPIVTSPFDAGIVAPPEPPASLFEPPASTDGEPGTDAPPSSSSPPSTTPTCAVPLPPGAVPAPPAPLPTVPGVSVPPEASGCVPGVSASAALDRFVAELLSWLRLLGLPAWA